MRVVGVQIPAAALLRVVFRRLGRIRPQVVSKRQMPCDLLAVRFEAVKLENAASRLWIFPRAIASSRHSVLAPILVAEFSPFGYLLVQRTHASRDRHQIDNRFGDDPGNGRRPDVMNDDQTASQPLQKPIAFSLGEVSPRRRMRHEFDLDRSGHDSFPSCDDPNHVDGRRSVPAAHNGRYASAVVADGRVSARVCTRSRRPVRPGSPVLPTEPARRWMDGNEKPPGVRRTPGGRNLAAGQRTDRDASPDPIARLMRTVHG